MKEIKIEESNVDILDIIITKTHKIENPVEFIIFK